MNIVQRIHPILQRLVLLGKPIRNHRLADNHQHPGSDSLGHLGRINLPQSFSRALDGALKVLSEARDVDRMKGVVEGAGEVFEVESARGISKGS